MKLSKKLQEKAVDALSNKTISWTEKGKNRTGYVKAVDFEKETVEVMTDKNRIKTFDLKKILF